MLFLWWTPPSDWISFYASVLQSPLVNALVRIPTLLFCMKCIKGGGASPFNTLTIRHAGTSGNFRSLICCTYLECCSTDNAEAFYPEFSGFFKQWLQRLQSSCICLGPCCETVSSMTKNQMDQSAKREKTLKLYLHQITLTTSQSHQFKNVKVLCFTKSQSKTVCFRYKTCRVGACLMCKCSSFHSFGAASAKARSPLSFHWPEWRWGGGADPP